MLTIGQADLNVISDLGRKYNQLIDEKFALIDCLKTESLYTFQRVNLRLQISELHHHILRIDAIRGSIAFGWKYEVSERATIVALEIKKEDDRRLKQANEINKARIDDLTCRLERKITEVQQLRALVYKANDKLKLNGIQPVGTITLPKINEHNGEADTFG